MDHLGEDYSRKEGVREMFNSIAYRYDFLDHLMSFGIDHYWRRRALDYLKNDSPRLMLDVATGTADLAIKAAIMLKPDKIIGVDIAEKMLEVGKAKVVKKALTAVIDLQKGDAEALAFPDDHFDAITIAFGVRNFMNTEKGLSEMLRVLKKGGRIVILEFSMPQKFPVKQFYGCYFNFLVPQLGRYFARHKIAYEYLPGSVSVFPYGENFVRILKDIGFKNIEFKTLTFGICTVYSGLK